jgi:hypothetical protein
MSIIAKRFAQSVMVQAEAMNRAQQTGGGGGFQPMTNLGYAAAGNQGAFSTANNGTWTDITNSSFAIVVSRPSFFLYLVSCGARLSAAGNLGYVRGNIVGYDTTAALNFGPTATTNGFIWYGPYIKGPIQPGTYTVKMQAATDNNTFNINIDGLFHQFLSLAG